MEIKKGDKFPVWCGKEEIRVMAVVEGYVVARFKGCAPFIDTKKRFLTRLAFSKNYPGLEK